MSVSLHPDRRPGLSQRLCFPSRKKGFLRQKAPSTAHSISLWTSCLPPTPQQQLLRWRGKALVFRLWAPSWGHVHRAGHGRMWGAGLFSSPATSKLGQAGLWQALTPLEGTRGRLGE